MGSLVCVREHALLVGIFPPLKPSSRRTNYYSTNSKRRTGDKQEDRVASNYHGLSSFRERFSRLFIVLRCDSVSSRWFLHDANNTAGSNGVHCLPEDVECGRTLLSKSLLTASRASRKSRQRRGHRCALELRLTSSKKTFRTTQTWSAFRQLLDISRCTLHIIYGRCVWLVGFERILLVSDASGEDLIPRGAESYIKYVGQRRPTVLVRIIYSSTGSQRCFRLFRRRGVATPFSYCFSLSHLRCYLIKCDRNRAWDANNPMPCTVSCSW